MSAIDCGEGGGVSFKKVLYFSQSIFRLFGGEHECSKHNEYIIELKLLAVGGKGGLRRIEKKIGFQIM